MKLGIVVLTNQQSGAAFNTITNTIKDSYLGLEDRNWLKNYGERMSKAEQMYDKQKKEAFAKSVMEATKEDRDLIRALPNFNNEKFLEISGVDLSQLDN